MRREDKEKKAGLDFCAVLLAFPPSPAPTPREESVTIANPDVVFLKGILVLYNPEVRALLDVKLFADLDSDRRLSSRGPSRAREKSRVMGRVAIAWRSRRASFLRLADSDARQKAGARPARVPRLLPGLQQGLLRRVYAAGALRPGLVGRPCSSA